MAVPELRQDEVLLVLNGGGDITFLAYGRPNQPPEEHLNPKPIVDLSAGQSIDFATHEGGITHLIGVHEVAFTRVRAKDGNDMWCTVKNGKWYS
jgi:hypothetical protein